MVSDTSDTALTKSIIVLCVDRDNDLEHKAGVKTPVIGRKNCLDAAVKLAIADPEEADANTIFAAIKLYDELIKKEYKAEVAIVSGKFERGVEADEKIGRETRKVVKTFPADGIALVSDGFEDEAVVPILQGILPIVSVKRVAVKHSRGIEESYMVLGRYLRMAVFDPRYSKYFLGVPGLLLLIAGLMTYLGLIEEAMTVMLSIIGAALIARGFSIDRALSHLTKLKPSGYIKLFSTLASLLVGGAAFQQGFAKIGQIPEYSMILVEPHLILKYGPALIGFFIQESLFYLWIALGIFFSGMLLSHALIKSIKVFRDILTLVILSLLYFPIYQFSLILIGQTTPVTLVTFLLLGLAGTFFIVIVIYEYIRSRKLLEGSS
ncbi:MAG: DUF373 family protein [Nitrososphaerales archaeon]|nr:DUF373 family protein [Nitrososphaerales archaeon]